MKNLLIARRDAVSNWIVQFVTILDIEKRLYKIQQSLFGLIKWGTFQPLPEIEYVLVFRSLFVKCEPCSFEENDDNPNAFFQVSLVHHKNRRIILRETRDRNGAFAYAREVAAALNLKVRDSASQRGKSAWLVQ